MEKIQNGVHALEGSKMEITNSKFVSATQPERIRITNQIPETTEIPVRKRLTGPGDINMYSLLQLVSLAAKSPVKITVTKELFEKLREQIPTNSEGVPSVGSVTIVQE